MSSPPADGSHQRIESARVDFHFQMMSEEELLQAKLKEQASREKQRKSSRLFAMIVMFFVFIAIIVTLVILLDPNAKNTDFDGVDGTGVDPSLPVDKPDERCPFMTGCTRHLTILISMDAFRASFVTSPPFMNYAPNIRSFMEKGIYAKAMLPSFPSYTFPNHYTLATGLFPETHGLLGNIFYNPLSGRTFAVSNYTELMQPEWWAGGEPIWITAEKQQLRCAALLFPGSEILIQNSRPTFYQAYNKSIPVSDRVDHLLRLIDLPENERPHLLMSYFSDVDDATHEFGPASQEMNDAIRTVDTGIGRLMAGLATRGFDPATNVNVVLVSDHGNTEMGGADSLIYLDDFIDLSTVKFVHLSPVCQLFPRPDTDVAQLMTQLAAIPHFTAWLKADVPPRFHFSSNPMIAPIVGLVDLGYLLRTRADIGSQTPKGGHGYDPALSDMASLFTAAGPAFTPGGRFEQLLNVDVQPLLADLLKLSMTHMLKPVNGSLAAFNSTNTNNLVGQVYKPLIRPPEQNKP